jgi:hypothetical protein
MFHMPRLYLPLQAVAPVEQCLVARREIANQLTPLPEFGSCRPAPWNHLVVDKVVKRARNPQAAA